MLHDTRAVFADLHHQATEEILKLLEGFFSNLEFGLFELAAHLDDEGIQSRCFDLMREMRLGKSRLLEHFTRSLEADQQLWTEGERDADKVKDESLYREALSLADNRSAHFSSVMQLISQRTAYATERDPEEILLPISPLRIAYNFLYSVRLIETDELLAAMVHGLFGRLVLDRLGTMYGRCNKSLEESGYPSDTELADSSTNVEDRAVA